MIFRDPKRPRVAIPPSEIAAESSLVKQPPTPASAPSNQKGEKITWLTNDKNRYNKFSYRLSQIIGGKERWEELKQASHAEQEAFVLEVERYPPGKAPPTIVHRATTVAKVKDEGIEGEWETFNAMAARDGHDLVIEMLEYGTLTSRVNPNLPPHTKIQHPFNLLVARVKQVWSSKKQGTVETTHRTDEETNEDNAAEVQREYDSITGGVPGLGVPPKASVPAPAATPAPLAGGGAPVAAGQEQETQKETKPELSERDKTVLVAIRKAHSMWDRNTRKWSADLDTSASNQNTRGTRPEGELSKIVQSCEGLHTTMMAVERKLTQNTSLTDKEIESVTKTMTALTSTMKSGAKIATALRGWFTVQDVHPSLHPLAQ